jgi:hypothetical protein
MSRTHSILVTALLCVAAPACATSAAQQPAMLATYSTQMPDGPIQVRNLEGDVLPGYALADAGSYIEVTCGDGQVYQIVDQQKDLYSLSKERTTSVGQGLDGICGRVRTSRLDYNHLH